MPYLYHITSSTGLRSTHRAKLCVSLMVLAMLASHANAGPTITLLLPQGTHPAQAGDEVTVVVRMSNLGSELAAGFQAFLEYDPDQLAFMSGSYTAVPFGLHVINPIVSVDHTIDLASGVNFFAGQQPTSSDADLVHLTFELQQDGCVASLVFREGIAPTRITDPAGSPLEPLTLVSLPLGQPVADINGDGVVNVSDLLILLGSWGDCSGVCPSDLNCDGVVNVSDLLILLGAWGPVASEDDKNGRN
jgi:hypothetical protein